MQMTFDASSDLDDDSLIVLYASGDQSAAIELLRRLSPGVMALARRMMRDETEAEDVTQEAMLKLWKIAPDWEPGRAKPSTWLYRITSNLCTDRLRKRRVSYTDTLDEIEDESLSALENLEYQDRANAVNSALAELPERQNIAMHLRYYQQLSNGDIADALETSVEAVESLLARGKRELAKKLGRKKKELGLA